MSLTKIVATFAFVVTLTVAFSSSNQVQAQSGSRSVGGSVGGAAGSGSRSVPSVVTDFGGAQETYSEGAPVASSAPVVSSGSDCGCSAAPLAVASPCGCSAAPLVVASPCDCSPVPAPQPVASPCGGGCGGGCPGQACGNRDFGNLRRGPALGARGRLFQRGRPCTGGCN